MHILSGVAGYIFFFLAATIVLWPGVRAWRLWTLREKARQKMQWGAQEARALRDQMSKFAGQPINQAELAAYGTLSAAEYAWSWARIDPEVIKAAAFSSSVPIHNGYDFAQYIHSHYDTLGAAAKDCFFNRLMGYVGEQKVADLLVHQGHVVQVAESATHPVWDLLVDGHAANIKTVQDVASIKAEAMAHHGVTYLVPTDAHGSLTENMAHVVGFKHDAVRHGLHHGVEAAHGETASHALGMHLPLLTIGFAAYRNYQAVQMGKNLNVALKHTVVESVGRGAGGILGGKAGGVIGFAVGGPLGALIGAVGGAVGGALLGGSVAEQFKRKPLEAAFARMEAALHEFGAGFDHQQLQTIQGYLEAPLSRMRGAMREIQAELEQRRCRIVWWFWPDFATVLLEETVTKGQESLSTEQRKVNRITAIFNDAQRTGQFAQVGLMMVNAPEVRELVGFDADMLNKVQAAQKSVFFERKQLDPTFVAPC